MGIANHAVAWDRLNRGDPEGADEVLLTALAALRDCGSRLNECLVLNTLGGVALDRGDLARADEWYAVSLEVALDLKDPAREALVRSNLGWVACLRGASEEGLRELEASVRLYRGIGHGVGLGSALVRLAESLCDLDRWDEAESAAREALEIATAVDRGLLERVHRVLALLATRRGDAEAAEGWLPPPGTDDRPSTRTQRAAALHVRAEIALLRGDRAAARAAMDAARALTAPTALGSRFRVLWEELRDG